MNLLTKGNVAQMTTKKTENAQELNKKGNDAYRRKDYKEAFAYFSKAAELGHLDAQNSLGNCYYNGEGVRKDYKKAVYWYKKAAGKGHVAAQGHLGDCYANGEGVLKSERWSEYWYTRARI